MVSYLGPSFFSNRLHENEPRIDPRRCATLNNEVMYVGITFVDSTYKYALITIVLQLDMDIPQDVPENRFANSSTMILAIALSVRWC